MKRFIFSMKRFIFSSESILGPVFGLNFGFGFDAQFWMALEEVSEYNIYSPSRPRFSRWFSDTMRLYGSLTQCLGTYPRDVPCIQNDELCI